MRLFLEDPPCPPVADGHWGLTLSQLRDDNHGKRYRNMLGVWLALWEETLLKLPELHGPDCAAWVDFAERTYSGGVMVIALACVDLHWVPAMSGARARKQWLLA